MKRCTISSTVVLTLCALLFFSATGLRAQRSIWSTAYYAGWMQGYLTPQNIDYGAVTHIIHFALVPQADGTLNETPNAVTAANASALVIPAHAAGKKVIISVGGWGSGNLFLGATSTTNRPVFIANLVNLMKNRAYDGIDVDWEPINPSDAPQFTAFITELRAALDAITPRPLLTVAAAWEPSIIAQVSSKFDQVNIMTYDLSGAWQAWVTWHNSPIYDGGLYFPGTSRLVPSANAMVDAFVSAGVPASKLGIGMDFYGDVWSAGAGMPNGGATGPDQSWTTAPAVQANVPFFTIMNTYYQSQYARWDTTAQVPYLSIDNTGSANDKFISYDNAVSCAKKVEYARNKGIGGVMIWELGGGYRADQPAGQRDALLQAVKQALGGVVPSDTVPPAVTFAAPANGATLSNSVTLNASATDNTCMGGVQFMLYGSNLGVEVTTSPYSITWNTTSVKNGSYTVSAVARDTSGNRATASITVTVSNAVAPPSDTVPPVITFSAPANGATVSNTILLSVNATDNVCMGGVQFTVNGSNLGIEVTTSPYSISWNTTSVKNGSYAVAAVARDTSGNKATGSVAVTVSNVVAAPPTVTITNPLNGAKVKGTVTVSATASGGTKIMGVQFKLDGNTLGNELTSAPYRVTWNSTQVANGAHTITATARDSAGLQASASVGVIVSNKTSGPPSLWVYLSSLQSPWNNASWNATLTLNSTEQKYSGSPSVKVVQGVWGGASFHSGNWNSPIAVNPSQYQSVEFAVYGGASGATITLVLQNDAGNSFPGVSTGTVPANTWKVMTIPMMVLDPSGYVIHRVSIMEISGVARTYYIANLRFIGISSSQGMPMVLAAAQAEPATFSLSQNYPNPFNPSTSIAYTIAQDASVTIEVYNTLGQRVGLLVNEVETAGEHQTQFNGAELPSGVYFYRLSARPVSGGEVGAFIATKRMTLLK